MDCRSAELLNCWTAGLLNYRTAGLLAYRNAELLDCRNVERTPEHHGYFAFDCYKIAFEAEI